MPKGFVSAATSCGIKEKGADRLDLALIYSQHPTVGAAVYTNNKVKAAPVQVSAKALKKHAPRAIIANSGNANACTGEVGMRDAKAMVAATAEALDLDKNEVQVCSTGIIGLALPIDRILSGISEVAPQLRRKDTDVTQAIMTSDTRPKACAVEYQDTSGNTIKIGAIAKGAGMINPNMATMLCFVTTDYNGSADYIEKATREAVNQSFNCISVDGDMSTNDTVILMANAQAGNRKDSGKQLFQEALNHVLLDLAKKMVSDGERVTKLVAVQVSGANSDKDAEKVARAVGNSKLVKCSWNGCDPNWGRVIHAIGYAGAKIREEKINIGFSGVPACKNGLTAETPISKLTAVVNKSEFSVDIDLNIGEGSFTLYTADLSPEYVEFNREEYALSRRKLG